ncbi:hypothetical protein G7Y89_g1028 [Cudoniella acicularis]|uniref:Uncharacterized protein n=1 Tax=Cudoniella acicularis TaxID=354080 RepID=A0A8H4W9X0_9HELO|nr:hypothetical protein G7Y89_g1028 [Cudoniella acicularis]
MLYPTMMGGCSGDDAYPFDNSDDEAEQCKTEPEPSKAKPKINGGMLSTTGEKFIRPPSYSYEFVPCPGEEGTGPEFKAWIRYIFLSKPEKFKIHSSEALQNIEEALSKLDRYDMWFIRQCVHNGSKTLWIWRFLGFDEERCRKLEDETRAGVLAYDQERYGEPTLLRKVLRFVIGI